MSSSLQRRLAPLALTLILAATGLNAKAALLWDQSEFGHLGPGFIASTILELGDFELAAPATVTGFRVWMMDGPPGFWGGDGIDDGQFRSFSGALSWYLYADARDAPGALLASGTEWAADVADTGLHTVISYTDGVFQVTGSFGAGVALPAGRSWFGVREGTVGGVYDGSTVLWQGSTVAAVGAPRYAFWDGQNQTDLQGPMELDLAFQLFGQPVPEPATTGLLLAGLVTLAGWRRHGAQSGVKS